MEITIRHYQISDQPAILELSADTAFFGDPVEAFLEDRSLFIDAFARYYTEHEAPMAWVAESSCGLAGFLFGCTDTASQSRLWRRYIISNVLVKALAGRYRLGSKTAGFAWGMLMGMMRGEETSVDTEIFPAHLQIDVRQGFRGEGVGKRLIEAYLEQLRQLNVLGVHLETTTHNQAACHLYEKVGFRLLDERPNRYWPHMLGFEVKNRCYGLGLR
jgi:ribosomal protein S18 acetylase RimI-like enzyme